ncbi:MAG: hypothetical protein HYY77_21750 [Betaproteobacteria bacterium]|nr:hypothetical protein [Betaproteobacteria bacterium]
MQRLGPIAGRGDPVALIFQDFLQQEAIGPVVVDDENHGREPAPGPRVTGMLPIPAVQLPATIGRTRAHVTHLNFLYQLE